VETIGFDTGILLLFDPILWGFNIGIKIKL
jgi:hypothetical protein